MGRSMLGNGIIVEVVGSKLILQVGWKWWWVWCEWSEGVDIVPTKHALASHYYKRA